MGYGDAGALALTGRIMGEWKRPAQEEMALLSQLNTRTQLQGIRPLASFSCALAEMLRGAKLSRCVASAKAGR